MSKFPKCLFVKQENDGHCDYFASDVTLTNFAEIGQKVRVGVYELVETREVEGVVSHRKV